MTAERAQRSTGSGPSAEVERLIGFLNSRPRADGNPDGLAGRAAAGRLLGGLGLGGVSPDAAGLERLRRLRDLLAVLADREDGDLGRTAAWRAVDELAAGLPMRVSFPSDVASVVRPAGEGVDAVLGALIADLHGAVSSGSWRRVRLCAYEPCSGAFYDATRSRTQRWHSYEVCGNRSNVAAYRRRAATGSAAESA
ncbi:MAG TPA: CGNR zinc finger domain-containing protein [Solirubrobacteraceae bacterium]|nr:CGNR zinc finger domain-containing protein [Solirubrobacteraceae bacterium]